MNEIELGKVKHYFARPRVAIIVCLRDGLAVGERLHIRGRTTDVEFPVESLRAGGKPVESVEPGKDVAVRVPEVVRRGDMVYKVK